MKGMETRRDPGSEGNKGSGEVIIREVMERVKQRLRVEVEGVVVVGERRMGTAVLCCVC